MTGALAAERRVAVVTGAGRVAGIGRAVAEHLVRAGHRVVLTDLGERAGAVAADVPGATELEQTVASLAPLGDVTAYACDVRDEDAVEGLFDAVLASHGRVDVLVNNAGLSAGLRPVVDLSLAEWQLNVDVMATGVFLCSRAAARRMVAAGRGGRIVTVASQAGKTGIPELAAYSSAKFAAIGFTQALALELGAHGITVNAVCPGTIDTPLNEVDGGIYDVYATRAGLERQEYKRRIVRHIPAGRLGTPDDVAAAVAFLVSDAAAFITGEALNVTGGQEVH